MWYAYVGPKMGGVTKDWSFIKHTVRKIPYATFRAYRHEEEAWCFVRSRKHQYILHGLSKYGDIFDKLYATLEYFITPTGLYANLHTSNLGYVRLGKVPKDVELEYLADIIMIYIPIKNIHRTSLESHAVSLLELLRIIGGLIDIEIILQDFSIYYMLNHYNGDKYVYKKLKDFISNRTGNIAYTIKYKYVKDTEEDK